MSQKVVKRVDIVDGEYIPTIGVPIKVWSTDQNGEPDWRDNPALISPATTKGDLIVYGDTEHQALAVGEDGYYLVADSSSPTGMSWQYDGNKQKEITDPTYTVINADDKYTIFFNSPTSITVTVDHITLPKVEVDFYNLGEGAVNFVQGTADLGLPDGSTLLKDKVCALIKVLDRNSYKLKGELI